MRLILSFLVQCDWSGVRVPVGVRPLQIFIYPGLLLPTVPTGEEPGGFFKGIFTVIYA